MQQSSATPLRNPSFLAIWLGEAVSTLGGSFGTLASSWFLYTYLGESELAIGSMWLMYFLPSLFVQLLAGPSIDRWNRKTIMLAAQFSRAACYLVPLVMLYTGELASWHIYLVSIVTGLIQPLYVPASLALLPTLLEKRQLEQANAYIDGTSRLMLVLGPPLGGLLISQLDAAATLCIVVTAYMLSGLLLFLCPSPAATVQASEPWVRQFTAGFGYFFQQKTLLWLGIFLAFVQFGIGVTMVLNMPYVLTELHGTTFHYGLFIAGYPLGYFLGTRLLSGSGVKLKRNRRIVMLGALVCGGLSFLLLAWIQSIWLAVFIELLAGVAAPCFHVLSTSIYQRTVPNHLLGRVFSVRLLIIRSTMPLGVLFASLCAGSVGIRPIFALIGGITCLPAVLGMVLPHFRFLEQSESAKNIL